MKPFKSWSDFTKEELIAICSLIDNCAYGDIQLNLNDIIAPAAYGVDCDSFDLPAVSELFAKFGHDGVFAWACIKEGIDQPWRVGDSKKFKEAKKEIESNRIKYFWRDRYNHLNNKGEVHDNN